MHRDDSRNSAVSKGSGFFGGIKQKMVLIFCLISILVLIAANLTGLYGLPFGNYGGRVAVHRAEAFRLLNQVADTKKADLLNWIDERKDDLRQAAGERWVRNSAAQLHDLLQNAVAADGKITDVRAALMVHDSYHFLMEHIAYIKSSHMPIYEAIRIADAGTGVIMCSTVEKEVGGNISEHAAFQAYAGALSSATTYVADIFLSKQDAVPSINFSDVVRWPKNEAVAVIQMRVNADKAFDPILHSGGGLGAKGEALLVNRQQFVLTSLRFPMADGTRANPLRDRISAEPARLAAGGNEGNIEIEDYRGVPVLAAYRYIRIAPDWGWGMVVKLDRSEIMSPLKQDIVSSIWIGLLGVVAVVILTLSLQDESSDPLPSLRMPQHVWRAGTARCEATLIAGMKSESWQPLLIPWQIQLKRHGMSWRAIPNRSGSPGTHLPPGDRSRTECSPSPMR